MADLPIKRYALIPKEGGDGVRRFQLARVDGRPRRAERLERMEEIAARERRAKGDGPAPPDSRG